MAEAQETIEESGSETEGKDAFARAHCQKIVRRYATGAIWPSDHPEVVKNILGRMAHDLAESFGRAVDDVSLEDLARAQAYLQNICSKVGLHRVRLGKIRSAKEAYDKYSAVMALVSNAYSIGSLFFGNFGPLIRKIGLKISGAPLGRVVGVWLAGQVLIELYWDPDNFVKVSKDEAQYHPLFDAFNLEQLRELALLMGIDPRVSWSPERIKKAILTELTNAYHNKVVAFWSEAPSYKNVLLILCEELEIAQYLPNDSEELLEERIVQRVLSQTVENMSTEQLKTFENAIRSNTQDGYWSKSVSSTIFAGGLVAGNMTGFGLYIAASSALAALGKGLGITFAFSTYTTLSSALSVVFGPVGIGLGASAAALHWTKSRPKKALPFVLFMAIARGQLRAESEKKLKPVQRLLLWVKRTLRIY